MRRSQQAIDRTARCDPGILLGGYGNVAVDVEPLAARAVPHAACATATKERHASGAKAAALDERSSSGATRTMREKLHDPANRVRAIDVATAAALNLDSIERDLRNLVPVDPATECIVERHPVDQHQRAALCRAADAAQCHALCGRIGCPRRCPAKEGEPGH